MKFRVIARSLVALAALVLTMMIALPAQAATATATFTKVSDWGTGFEGKYTVTNGGTTTINGWSVAFDLPSGASIGSFWDAAMSRSGQRFTFTNVGWNGTLAPGATASFGFNGSPGRTTPSNCTLNGVACGGGTTIQVPGKPGTPTATAGANAVALSWGASSGTVTGYRVYEGTTLKGTVTGTSATISGLGACSRTPTRSRPTTPRASRPQSDAASATTTGCTTGVPGTPGTPSATGDSNSIALSWGASSAARLPATGCTRARP